MARARRGPARFWRCDRCGAHALTEVTLRKIIPPPVWEAIWPAIREAATRGARECPMCAQPMDETRELRDAGSLRVDFCDRCRLVWLDPHELDRMPKVPVAENPAIPREVARLLAQAIAAEYDARAETIFQPFRDCAVGIFWALVGGLSRRRR
jgi:Zn-finger nucleic acid-binding protein